MSADRPIRVLFAEDEMPLRLLGELTLSDVPDLQLTIVEDGYQAIAELQADPHRHIVITDKDMPGFNGLEVIRHAKEVNPDSITVLVTASSEFEIIKRRATELQIDKVVKKPYSPKEFLSMVNNFIIQIDAAR